MKRLKLVLSYTAIACISGCSGESDPGNVPEEPGNGGSYSNPVIAQSVPDPTVIRAEDGYFYLYGTEDVYNMPIFRSSDMVHWTKINTVFNDATRPDWDGAHT